MGMGTSSPAQPQGRGSHRYSSSQYDHRYAQPAYPQQGGYQQGGYQQGGYSGGPYQSGPHQPGPPPQQHHNPHGYNNRPPNVQNKGQQGAPGGYNALDVLAADGANLTELTSEGHTYQLPTGEDGNESLNMLHANAQGATMYMQAVQKDVLEQKSNVEFEKTKKLGQGGFGVVWLCERKKNSRTGRDMPRQFALKELISPKLFTPGPGANIRDHLPLNEAAIQRYMKHEHIVETYWADVRCLDPDTLQPLTIGASDLLADTWTSLGDLNRMDQAMTSTIGARQQMPQRVMLQMRIAMENCDLGSLKDYLVDPTQSQPSHLAHVLSEKKLGKKIHPKLCAMLTSLDIAQALKFMHKSKTLHGDLKPHNILLKTDNNAEDKGFSAKISDFGLSEHMRGEQQSVEISSGTEAYLPWEVFKHMAVTEASDVYTLGLLIWEAWYGIFWWSIFEKEKAKRKIRAIGGLTDFGPRCDKRCPPEFASIVHDCLKKEPNERPKAADVESRLIGCIQQFYERQAQKGH